MVDNADLRNGAAYFDGRVVPIHEARIPVTDMGVTRSDVTYDVVAVWDGAFFRLPDHLERFERSCRKLRLDPGVDSEEMARILHDLVALTRLRESYVEIACTRGELKPGSRDPREATNRFYAFAIPYVWISPPNRGQGIRAVIARTVVRIPPESVDPTVKNFHWGDLVRGLFEAYERGGDNVLLQGTDGYITEGPGYNVFAVVGRQILTPRRGVLEGITRRTVLELAAEHGIDTAETDIDEALLRSAEELFATSTAGGVMPIVSLDGYPVGAGEAGTTTTLLSDAYWAAHAEDRFRSPVQSAT